MNSALALGTAAAVCYVRSKMVRDDTLWMHNTIFFIVQKMLNENVWKDLHMFTYKYKHGALA